MFVERKSPVAPTGKPCRLSTGPTGCLDLKRPGENALHGGRRDGALVLVHGLHML